MHRHDWLEEQLRQLARGIAAVLGSEDRSAEIDRQLEGLVGMPLRVLTPLPPAMVARLVGQRFGQDQPERLYAALRLVELAIDEGHALDAHRQALYATLLDTVGPERLMELGRETEALAPPVIH